MAPLFRSVRCYFCLEECVRLCVCWLLEEPVIYVCSGWHVSVCGFVVEMCEARGVAEAGEWWVV